jgi:hypothetical protein
MPGGNVELLPSRTAEISGETLPSRLAALRQLIAEKFPVCELKTAGMFATGVAAFDESEGGLRRGAFSELVGPLSAGGLFIEGILAAVERERCFAALVDVGRTFDPQGTNPATLRRLLWVCCANPMQAVKATDLLLRDGNLPLIVLDLQSAPASELRRIPASTWHRFQRLVEPTSTALVALTSQPMIESASVRIAVRQRWTLAAMRERRRELLTRVEAQVFARRQLAVLPSHEERRRSA